MAHNLPLVLHVIVETAAASSFILAPHRQLSSPSAEAQLILKSYGGLLLATNMVCLGVLLRPEFEGARRLVGVSMAFYHIWPAYRAWQRMANDIGMKEEQANNLGGPGWHLVIHVLLSVFLGAEAFQ